MIHASKTAAFYVAALRDFWGTNRIAQTTSKKDPRFSVVRIYLSPIDKGNPIRAIRHCRTLSELRIAARIYGGLHEG